MNRLAFTLVLALAVAPGGRADDTSLARWLTDLAAGDPGTRNAAIYGITVYGRDAVGPLRLALADADPMVRSSAARALGTVGVDAAPAADELAALTADTDPNVRAAAVLSLSKIGRAGVPALTAAVNCDDADLRLAALRGLGANRHALAPAAAALARRLGDENATVRTLAASLLLSADPRDARAADALGGLLKDAETRLETLAALQEAGPAAAPVVPHLKRHWANFRKQERLAAVIAAGLIGPGAKDLLPLLTPEVRQSADAEMRLAAAVAVCRLGAAGAAGFPDAVACLNDTTNGLHGGVSQALVLAGPPTVSALAEGLKMKGAFGRTMAALTLRDLGVLSLRAAPALRDSLASDSDYQVRYYAAQALGQIAAASPPAAERDAIVVALTKALGDGEPYVRHHAAEALAKYGPAAAAAAPKLAALLKDPVAAPQAAVALAAINPARAAEAAAALVPFLTHAEANTRSFAGVALGEIGPAAKLAVPALLKALSAPENVQNWVCAESAAFALLRIDSAAAAPGLKWLADFHGRRVQGGSTSEVEQEARRLGAAVAPAFLRALASPDAQIRSFAAMGIVWTAPLADTVCELGKLLAAPEPSIRRLAATELGRLDAAAAPSLAGLRKLQSAPDEVQAAAAEAVRAITAAIDASKGP